MSFAIASFIASSTAFLFFSTAGPKNGCGLVPFFAMPFARKQGEGDQGSMKFEDFAKKITEEVNNMINKW